MFVLCHFQVNDIVALWHNLLDYDKQRVVFAARHQDRLTTGRFRSPKKKAVSTPGVDSLKRCVLGSTASPGQWPDCCRLIEAIFIRLCRIHRSPRKKGKGSFTRWTLILHDYGMIRQLILNNEAIMQNTNLQLVEVNQTTLVQWHNNRVRRQDLSVLLQGINLPSPLPVAAEPLPPASVRPASPPSQSRREEHTYNMPQSTVGRAKLKGRITSMPPEETAEVVRPSQRLLLPRPQGIMGPVHVLSTGPSSSAKLCFSIYPCIHSVCCPYTHSKPFVNSPGQQCSFTLCNSAYRSATCVQ